MSNTSKDRERFIGWNRPADADLAEDTLHEIALTKEGFLRDFIMLYARNPEIEWRGLISEFEENFDDMLHKKWCVSLDISGSLEYGPCVPTFAQMATKLGMLLPWERN